MAITIPDPIKADCKKKGGLRGIKKGLPPKRDIERQSRDYQALADPIRLKILLAVCEQPLCVCLLKEIVKISDSKMSYHLSILKDAKIITGKKNGSWIIYYPTEKGENYAREINR